MFEDLKFDWRGEIDRFDKCYECNQHIVISWDDQIGVDAYV